MQAMGLSDPSSTEEDVRNALMEPTKKYGHALRFAAEKNLRPGMGFLNGRPVDGSDPNSISQAFGEEQQHIFGLIMTNEITDSSPKSVYAKLLSGDKVYKKVHPLLMTGHDDDVSNYVLLDHDFGPESLLFPQSSTDDSKAFFVGEAVMNYSNDGGFARLKTFLKAIYDFPASVDTIDGPVKVSVGYRIIPGSKEDAESLLCPLLAAASRIGVGNLLTIVEQFEASGSAMSFDQLVDISPDLVGAISSHSCSNIAYLADEWVPKESMILLNGRLYEPDNGVITADDVDLLLGIEFPRAGAVYETFRSSTSSDHSEAVDACGKISAYLGVERTMSFKRSDIVGLVKDVEVQGGIESNPLRFSVIGSSSDTTRLDSKVVVILDPVSDATQRVASILTLFSETLGLTIDVILSPAQLIDGDSVSVYIK